MELWEETWFRLSSAEGQGIACNDDGVFIGGVPLLERTAEKGKRECWEPRALKDLNSNLTERFGLPIDFARNMAGLRAIAGALDQGDLARAQIATLLLGIPDPPDLTKSSRSTKEVLETGRHLKASGILKAEWDAGEHPRWPAGSPGGIGGEFSPGGDGSTSAYSNPSDSRNVSSNPLVIPTEFVIPSSPFDIPFPGELSTPRPFEILPPPLVFPNTNPRDRPKNPYPRRRECVKEWEDAEDFCDKLMQEGKMGSDGHRGFGQWYYQCILGQVSEDCGGNSTSA